MSTRVEDLFVGEPTPEETFSRRRSRYQWEAILGAIKPGTGREVIMSYGTCKKAIEDLEGLGTIRKNEYRVKYRMGPDGKRRTFIIHKSLKK